MERKQAEKGVRHVKTGVNSRVGRVGPRDTVFHNEVGEGLQTEGTKS